MHWLIAIVLFIVLVGLIAVYQVGFTRSTRNALKGLDQVVSGKRVVGASSTLIKSKRLEADGEDAPISIAQLCRISNGQWFEHRFEISLIWRVTNRVVSLLNEDDAKTWLAYDINAYERVFGQLEIA